MQDILRDFLDAMAERGFIPANPDLTANDKWHSVTQQGDKPSKRVLYYRLKIDDDFAVGNFGSYREGVTYTWTSKASREYMPEEREVWKKKIEAEKEAKESERIDAQARASKLAQERWESADLLIDAHPYLERKGVMPDGLRIDGDTLLVPMTDTKGKLWSLQTISPDGDKLYMAGARKEGCYYSIGSKNTEAIIICEGVATAASIAQAIPEHMVIAAFDAGNLKPVAEAIRRKHKEAKIVIACDNDAFTERGNTGIEKGKQAALKAEGFAIWPEFVNNDDTKYTDYNDLHISQGLESVRNSILPIINNSAGGVPAEVSLEPLVTVGVQASAGDSIEETEGDLGLPFRILGYNQETYYYFPFEKRQIFALNGASHTLNNLLQLASTNQWQRAFGGGHTELSPTQIPAIATNALFRIAHSRGVFTEENKVRGCGAWMDAGRRMLHCGNEIYVDGSPTDPKNVIGDYVYIAAPKLLKPSLTPLKSADAIKLRKICEMPTWETKLSGSLLAGWLVVAPVCSILPWRPHIWITGEAEAGKSTILDRIIKPALGAIALNLDGGTTEPAIRAMMGYDGRPIIYDEAESETINQRNTMDGVMQLARKASSGAVVAKAGQKPFKAQFCICFSAINPGVSAFADESRISMLTLKKNRKHTAQEDYDELLNEIAETITPQFQAGLLARTVANMPVLLENIDVFRRAVRKVLNAARVADQLAPMLAGLYLLGSDKVISDAKAEEWISAQDWTMNTAVASEPEHFRLMRHISTSIIRAGHLKEAQSDYTIGELISAIHKYNDRISTDFADRTLRMYSIAVRDGYVDVGNRNHNLGRLLKNTQWELNWHRTLSALQDSEQRAGVYFAAGDKQRAVRIPVKYFIDDEYDNLI